MRVTAGSLRRRPDERAADGRRVRRASQREVVRHWLAAERRARGQREPSADLPSDERAALDRLLELKPGAAAFVWRDDPEWYRVELTRAEFDALAVVAGPEAMRWRALSPDGTVAGAARRIARGDGDGDGDGDGLAAETGVDVRKVERLRGKLAEWQDAAFVVETRRGCGRTRVADGNHRAAAKALALRDGEPYRPQPVYLAVRENPVVEPLAERVCGVVRDLLGRARGGPKPDT